MAVRSFRSRLALLVIATGLAAFASACTGSGGEDDVARANGGEQDVRLDTRSPEARAQYQANVAFARDYAPRCQRNGDRPRVLLTGFGRFMRIANNASGRLVSRVVPAAPYPETSAPPAGQIDPPAPQLSVGTKALVLPRAGEVDVCAMVLPVAWDLAAILIAREIEAFDPAFVMMNGVAGDRQPLWLELGAVNRAAPLDDSSKKLRPDLMKDENAAKLVASAAPTEDAQPNLLSWDAVAAAARATIEAHAARVEGENEAGGEGKPAEAGVRDGARETAFGDIVQGVELVSYPREDNTYLCNSITFVTGYLMTHPARSVRLLEASPPVPGATNFVDVRLSRDLRDVPRVFVHWPADLATVHHEAGAAVMTAMIDAQLGALRAGDLPTPGENERAAPTP